MHDFALDFLKWMRVWIFASVYLCNKLKMKISFANRRKPKKGNIVCSIQSICRRYAFSRRRCPTFCTTSRRQWKLWKENITCANVIATGIRLPHLLFKRIAMHHTPRQQRRWQFSFFFLQSCFPFFSFIGSYEGEDFYMKFMARFIVVVIAMHFIFPIDLHPFIATWKMYRPSKRNESIHWRFPLQYRTTSCILYAFN